MGDGSQVRKTRVKRGRNLPDFNTECPYCNAVMHRDGWAAAHSYIELIATCKTCGKQYAVAPIAIMRKP